MDLSGINPYIVQEGAMVMSHPASHGPLPGSEAKETRKLVQIGTTRIAQNPACFNPP